MKKKNLYIGAAALILGMGVGLLSWYWFIAREQSVVTTADSGRGFATGVPTFGGGLGSTNLNTQSTFGTETQIEDNQDESSPAPRLWNVSSVPTAGISLFNPTSSTTLAYFIERVSGNIFSADPATGKVTRVTNTLIPYVYEAVWVDDTHILVRHIDKTGGVATLLGRIEQSTSSQNISTLNGTYLERGIVTVTANQQNHSFFTLAPTSDGYVGTVTSVEDEVAPKRVWKSSVGGWRSSWGDSSHISLLQKGAQGITGSMYLIDPEKREGSPVITGVAGLSAVVAPNGKDVVYSESYVGSFTTYLRTDGVVRKLGFKTLGEKCVWNAEGTVLYCAVPETLPDTPLPDAWYRGEVHFTDRWTGQADLLVSPSSDFGVDVDVIDPNIDVTGSYISFIDGQSGTPWMVRITEDE